MSSPSPYALEQAFSVLLSVRQRLLEEDPEIEHDERLMADCLDGESGDAMEVVRQLVRASMHAKSMAEAAKSRASDIQARADRYAKRETSLRGAVFAIMDAIGQRRIEAEDFTASISAGASGVVVTDETLLPDSVVRITRTPDKRAIADALKTGATIEGAEISNGPPRLTVRTK